MNLLQIIVILFQIRFSATPRLPRNLALSWLNLVVLLGAQKAVYGKPIGPVEVVPDIVQRARKVSINLTSLHVNDVQLGNTLQRVMHHHHVLLAILFKRNWIRRTYLFPGALQS